MTTSTNPTTEVVAVDAAGLVVTVARSVRDWQHRLANDDAPADLRLEALRMLDEHLAAGGSVDDLVVLDTDATYGFYPLGFRLPRNAMIVGWLDETGYRHATAACRLPSQAFLAQATTLLGEPDGAAVLNRGGATA